MEDNGVRRTEIEILGLSLIDVSSEDDSLLFSSILDPGSNEFLETDKDDKVLGFLRDEPDYDDEIPVSTLEEKEQVLQPHESPKPEKLLKSGKYNLRKSLAWDNAFFTNAGVLEPEELSSMIESNHKGERQNLPTIQEDLQRSTESISTFQSDCTVENSQEFVFFEDIRESIQRSAKASGASTPEKSKELVAIEAATGRTSCMAKGPRSQEKMKPKASPKKQSVRAQGLAKATTKQPVVAARGLNTSVPKVFGKVRPMPPTSMKRASLDVSKTKHEKDSKLAGGTHHLGSRISISASARPVLPRPVVVSSQSSLRSSVATTDELASSCSSLESYAGANALSSFSKKSSINLVRKKNDLSSLANRTRPKAAPRNVTRPKVAPRNVTQPSFPPFSGKGTSKSKLSPNVSPASSFSDWSSESSRASTPNKMPKGIRRTVSGAKGSASSDRPQSLKRHDNSKDDAFARCDSKVDELIHEGTERVSEGNGGLLHPASMKPSGLRVPSPKIGFFDGVRSVARTPTGNIQPRSSVLSSLSKHGVNSPNESEAKTKYEKLQPASARSPLQKFSNPKTKTSGVSRSLRVVSGSSPKAQKKMYSKISAEERLKGEADNEEKSAGENSSSWVMHKEGRRKQSSTGLAEETVKASPVNGKPNSSFDQNSASGDENTNSSCIELPKEGEISDKQSDKSAKPAVDMRSFWTLEMENEFIGTLLN